MAPPQRMRLLRPERSHGRMMRGATQDGTGFSRDPGSSAGKYIQLLVLLGTLQLGREALLYLVHEGRHV